MFTFPIEPPDATADFHCGDAKIDDYFRKHALTNHRRGLGRAYVLRHPEGAAYITQRGRDLPAEMPNVLGFYTLSAYSVLREALPKKQRRADLPSVVPFSLVGRMGVDERVRGYDLGRALVVDALRRSCDAAESVGSFGVFLHAKTEQLVAYYTTLDFIPIDGLAMFIPMDTIRSALQRSSERGPAPP